jgi:hypothetical protein
MFVYMRLPCSSKNGRAPSAAKAGSTVVRAGAKIKSIKEIDLEEWMNKRKALTPVKGGPQDRQGDVRDDASATTARCQRRQGNVCNEDSTTPASTPVGCWR